MRTFGVRARVAAAITAAALTLLTGATAATAATEDNYEFDPSTAAPLELGDIDPTEGPFTFVADNAEFGAGSIGTRATWAACGISDSNQKLVRTFSRVDSEGLRAGSSYLRCGSSAWGLRHIVDRHLAQWQSLALLGGSSSWRTFADWAFWQTLNHPAHVTYVSRNDTYHYKTELQIRDQSGRIRGEFYSNVIIARVSKSIITAYPSE